MSRRRRKEEPEEHVNHERWLVSYSDMMTVLMALFVVLYAISQVDQVKFDSLRQSLAAGFGSGDSVVLLNDAGIMDKPNDMVQVPEIEALLTSAKGIDSGTQQGGDAADGGAGDYTAQELGLAQAEYDHLKELRESIDKNLAKEHLEDSVEFRVTKQGLVIGMVTQDVFFEPESNRLSTTFKKVLDAVAPTLKRVTNDLSIEGHADIVPTGSLYETNWELSSARATSVLRRFVEHSEIKATRIAAVGFGDSRPLINKTDKKSLAANRRVDVVVLSDKPERVRALLPVIDAKNKE